MSFGFAIGDFIAAGELAVKLYRDCYMVARGVPQEFQLLLAEVSTLSHSLAILQEEVKNPTSTLVLAGEDRVRMVNEMVARISETLKRLQKVASKYGVLESSSKRKRIWAKLKWSSELSSIDALRNKIIYHNTVMNLLLTSVGNSSLQRIESINAKLEEDVKFIKSFIFSNQGTEHSQMLSLSAVDDEQTRISLYTAFIRNAEVFQPWNTIGLDQWMDAGRWWLLRSQMKLYSISKTKQSVPSEGYVNLIKASWIVVDIIAYHPQVSLLAASKFAEVQLLTAELKNQFTRLESLQSIFPDLSDLEGQDLRIWERGKKGLIVRAHKGPRSRHAWTVEGEEQILFQRYATCRLRTLAEALPSMLLLLVRKDAKAARLLAQDQNGSVILTIEVQKLAYSQLEDLTSVTLNGEQVTFPMAQDAQDVCAMLEATQFYVFEQVVNCPNLDSLKAYILLTAIKNEARGTVERMLPQLSELYAGNANNGEEEVLPIAVSLATQIISQGFVKQTHSLFGRPWHATSLFCWAIECGHTSLVKALLKDHDSILSSLGGLTPLGVASGGGNREIVQLFLDRGFQVQFSDKNGLFPLHWAVEGRNDNIVKLLLKAGADLDAQNSEGETALHLATHAGDMGKYREPIDHSHTQNGTGLQSTASASTERIVEFLLANGAEVDIKNEKGETALIKASRSGYTSIVKELIDYGSNIRAENNGGNTALLVAIENQQEAVIGILIDAGRSVLTLRMNLAHRTILAGMSAAVTHTILAMTYAAQYDSERVLRQAADRGHEGAKALLYSKGAEGSADALGASTQFARVKAVLIKFFSSQPAFNLTLKDAEVKRAEVRIRMECCGTRSSVLWLQSYHAYIEVPGDAASRGLISKNCGKRLHFSCPCNTPTNTPAHLRLVESLDFTFFVFHKEESLNFFISCPTDFVELEIFGGEARKLKSHVGPLDPSDGYRYIFRAKDMQLHSNPSTNQPPSSHSLKAQQPPTENRRFRKAYKKSTDQPLIKSTSITLSRGTSNRAIRPSPFRDT